MDKPYIICHILSALDGKIAGEFATTKSARSASEEYVRIPAVCEEMAREMGEGKYYPDLCERMAQYELTPPDLPGRPAIQRADGKARRLGR